MPSKKLKKTGLAPGTIVYTGNRKAEKVQIHYLKYDEKNLSEIEFDNHQDILISDDSYVVDWFDIRGIHDVELITKIGDGFKIHPLVLEEIVDIYQRPKFEEYDSGSLFLLKAVNYNSTDSKLIIEQICLYFTNEYLVSFQEDRTDIFHHVRDRVHKGKGKVRSRMADYLAFALVDSIVDNYFLVLDSIQEDIEKLEDEILNESNDDIRGRIHVLKKIIIQFRRQVLPLREAINAFAKSDSEYIADGSKLFIRDLFNQIIHITDMIDSKRDILNGLQDLYLSEISNRMNQIMKVLTIITTLFVPLSFLAGIYGMNFEYIPELNYKYGYFILLGFMMLIIASLIYFFKRKKWF